MHAFLGRRSNTGMRAENWLQGAAHLSIGMADGRGSWEMEGGGGGSRKQSNVGTAC